MLLAASILVGSSTAGLLFRVFFSDLEDFVNCLVSFVFCFLTSGASDCPSGRKMLAYLFYTVGAGCLTYFSLGRLLC